MPIREASEADGQRWNEFVAAAEAGSFLQSWEWGELQRELTIPYWRFLDEEQGAVKGVVLVTRRSLPLNKRT